MRPCATSKQKSLVNYLSHHFWCVIVIYKNQIIIILIKFHFLYILWYFCLFPYQFYIIRTFFLLCFAVMYSYFSPSVFTVSHLSPSVYRSLTHWLAESLSVLSPFIYCPVGWGCRIRRLHLCRGVRPPMSVLDMTLKNLMVSFQWCWIFGELLPGPLWLGMVALDRTLSMC